MLSLRLANGWKPPDRPAKNPSIPKKEMTSGGSRELGTNWGNGGCAVVLDYHTVAAGRLRLSGANLQTDPDLVGADATDRADC